MDMRRSNRSEMECLTHPCCFRVKSLKTLFLFLLKLSLTQATDESIPSRVCVLLWRDIFKTSNSPVISKALIMHSYRFSTVRMALVWTIHLVGHRGLIV